MDESDRRTLISLVRERSLAALGTIVEGAPLVSMVLYACEPDLSCLYIHVSRIAQHTRGLLSQPRVSIMISEPDRASRNPLALARVSIQGLARPLADGSPEFENARSLYLAVHPTAAINFELPDFLLMGVHPESARFIAGFGKIFDLDREAWARLAATARGPNTDVAPTDRARSFRRLD
jgi:putative heme iron utilization protein